MREKTAWKSETWVHELGTQTDIEERPLTKVEIVCRQYVCPICKQTKQYFTVNGFIVHGMKAYYHDQDYCGSEKCSKVIEKKCK